MRPSNRRGGPTRRRRNKWEPAVEQTRKFSLKPKQALSYMNTLNREKVTKYTFTAFNGKEKEADKSMICKGCEGYILTGSYTIKTDAQGESSLTVETQVKAPKRFRKKILFGMGWGLSYGNKN